MIEMIILLAVIVWFWNTAKKLGQNSVLWVFIGGLSYYIPAMLCSLLFAKLSFVQERINADNVFGFMAAATVLSVGIGAAVTLVARKILLSRGADFIRAEEERRRAIAAAASEPMGECPSCQAVIPLKVESCPKCSAEFTGQAVWKIKPL